MWESSHVLIIAEPAAAHDLDIIFQLLGLQTVLANADNWSEQITAAALDKPESLLSCVIGAPDCEAAGSMIQALRSWDDTLPVILQGDSALCDETWDDSIAQTVTACLTAVPGLTAMTDALYSAQNYRHAQLRYKNNGTGSAPNFRSLVGRTEEMQVVRSMMGQVADKEVTVLITGESGTGKEVVARNLHFSSDRRDKPFVPVNCGAIPAELLESELFGHEKGAFTGAISARSGRFEMAEGGTLFLDEIGDMPLNMQVKILRVLQERCFERVGGNKVINTDVRIIAATHRDLEDMIEAGTFREDLYYRLNVFPIEMPALRERSDDIPLIINELVGRMEKEQRGSVKFNSSAILSLGKHE